MSLAGTGVVAIWHDLLPEAKDDFYEWHNREHMPERVGIPGFRRGRRYIAVEGAPEFFNLYEADSPEVLGGRDYLDRLNAPTEWTKRVVPSFRNVARSICRVAFTGGVGSGGTMLTMRFDIDAEHRAAMVEALTARVLPTLVPRKGIAGVHLCLADEAVSKIETAEKKARADTTVVPTWIVLIEGIGAAEVRAAAEVLVSDLGELGARAPDIAVYQLEFTRLKTPSSAG
jgi:catechol 2,3-dioxygenase-like lactoylglutathione lyase family enzyme